VVVVLIAGCSSTHSTIATATSTTITITTGVFTTTGPAATTTSTTTPSRITDNLSAADVAAALSEVERAAARGDGSVGARQQLLYRYLSAHADFDAAVLADVAADVRIPVERIVSARQFGQARQAANPTPTPPSDTLPAWSIVAPPPVDELLSDYHAAEAATGIGWYWLAAINLQETRMGRIIGTSSAGAVGPMQFLPATWAHCCTGDPTIARDAIIGAATYLAQKGGPADMQAALHAYNPNDTYVATVTAFAENMRDNPQLFNAYHEWQVFYSSSAGVIRMPIGYSEAQPIDAAGYLLVHPDDAAG
jgi:membrane-bound lytic murein transglycosylase B